MRFLKNNFAYLVLGAVALALIFITISLQVSILSVQEPSAESRGFFTTLRTEIAGWLFPASLPEETATTLESSTVETGDVERSGNDTEGAVAAAPGSETIRGGGEEAAVVDQEAAAGAPAESVASLALTGMAAVLYNAENNTVSENDDILATIVGNSPTTVGFFGYAYYLKHQDRLRTIAIRLPDGQLVGPNATSVANGLYPLARPLYLYTSPAILREKPDVERFIGCYLSQLPQVMNEVGYLLPSRNLFAQAIQSFNASCQECRREVVAAHPLAENVPICDAGNTAATSIAVVGSSTVQPLSERMASVFAERGFRGTIEVDGSGTGAGFRNFCTLGRGDIVDASRSVTGEERANCSAIGRALVPFPIAVDALAIVVSVDNAFLQEASPEELQQIFAYARQWSDVNPTWPNEPIARAIPGAQSGTFDYFVEAIMEGNALRNLAALQANPLSDQSGLLGASTPTSTPVGSGAFLNNAPDVRLGFVEQDVTCTVNTRLAALIMERKYGLRVTTSAYPDVDALFKALSAKDPTQRVDLTFCYRDPTDRTVRQRYFSYTDFIGSGYLVDDSGRYVIVSNSNVKAPLERSNACLYQFLNRMNWEDGLTFNGGVLQAQEVPKWYEENLVHIDRWASCD